ncbi:hypothetical protein GCM10010254_51260 [Streptomyces chromofuscus]|nr:hypothetical protein GCM10010254_51260 [Streptomyces chromofuscus]
MHPEAASRAPGTAVSSAGSRAATISTGSAVAAAAHTAARATSTRSGVRAHSRRTARKAPAARPNCSRVRACCAADSHTRAGRAELLGRGEQEGPRVRRPQRYGPAPLGSAAPPVRGTDVRWIRWTSGATSDVKGALNGGR